MNTQPVKMMPPQAGCVLTSPVATPLTDGTPEIAEATIVEVVKSTFHATVGTVFELELKAAIELRCAALETGIAIEINDMSQFKTLWSKAYRHVGFAVAGVRKAISKQLVAERRRISATDGDQLELVERSRVPSASSIWKDVPILWAWETHVGRGNKTVQVTITPADREHMEFEARFNMWNGTNLIYYFEDKLSAKHQSVKLAEKLLEGATDA